MSIAATEVLVVLQFAAVGASAPLGVWALTMPLGCAAESRSPAKPNCPERKLKPGGKGARHSGNVSCLPGLKANTAATGKRNTDLRAVSRTELPYYRLRLRITSSQSKPSNRQFCRGRRRVSTDDAKVALGWLSGRDSARAPALKRPSCLLRADSASLISVEDLVCLKLFCVATASNR